LSFCASFRFLPDMERRFLFLLSSARPGGNSALLAQAAAAPLPAHGQHWIDLSAAQLPPYRDLRPETAQPEGYLATIMEAMRAASDIVIVAPVYWYALPAPAKLLLDHWSGWFDAPETGFADWAREKTLYLITARADPDPTVPDLLEAMVKRSILWLGMRWGGALHGVGDAVGEIAQDKAAMASAADFLTEGTLP
jgi:multimeric flavodoxin WrbA